jgi:hypothetical protein
VRTLFTFQIERELERKKERERERERKKERERERKKERERERERERELHARTSGKCGHALSIPHSASQSACIIIILMESYITFICGI